MVAARDAATFSVERVRALLYSHRDLDRRRRVREILSRDPIFDKSERFVVACPTHDCVYSEGLILKILGSFITDCPW
jgi:hypothetical protein